MLNNDIGFNDQPKSVLGLHKWIKKFTMYGGEYTSSSIDSDLGRIHFIQYKLAAHNCKKNRENLIKSMWMMIRNKIEDSGEMQTIFWRSKFRIKKYKKLLSFLGEEVKDPVFISARFSMVPYDINKKVKKCSTT